jgi:hypothetical protein
MPMRRNVKPNTVANFILGGSFRSKTYASLVEAN